MTADEATAIRASAETRIVETRRLADRRALATGAVLVLGVTAFYSWQEHLEATLGIGLDWLPYAIYLAGSLTIAHIYWHWDRGILLLREAIAHALLARSSLPAELAGPRARREPNYRRLGALVFALLGPDRDRHAGARSSRRFGRREREPRMGRHHRRRRDRARSCSTSSARRVLTALQRLPPKDGPRRLARRALAPARGPRLFFDAEIVRDRGVRVEHLARRLDDPVGSLRGARARMTMMPTPISAPQIRIDPKMWNE